MELIALKECDKSFDFQALAEWPEFWPPFAYNKIQISGFKSQNPLALNFKPPVNFLSLFFSCHPRLQLSELADINHRWNTIPPEWDFTWGAFFKAYGLHQEVKSIQKLLTSLKSTPLSFQNWVSKKQAHFNDLRILNSFKNTKDLSTLFDWMEKKQVSHAQGVKALRGAGELLLMGKDISPALNHSPERSSEEDLQVLEQMRHPHTSLRDEAQKRKIQEALWPSGTQSEWVRKGDRAGLQIKIWCKTPQEFDKKWNQIHKTVLSNSLLVPPPF